MELGGGDSGVLDSGVLDSGVLDSGDGVGVGGADGVLPGSGDEDCGAGVGSVVLDWGGTGGLR